MGDFVTIRECEIKDENMRRSLDHLRVSVEDYIVHSREMEAKLFDGQDKINILLATEMEKAKSTQIELTEHKTNNSHLNLTTMIGGITIIGALCSGILYVSLHLVK